ncbi:hypothetical protein L6452_43669 [Arctium lappa]|uniref:Uncharacterized protein n=1 Tax=Arctium lappa TaxID=4217 RepID=A0ACB8XEC5_ARCLA|nr:hypothetical protein L6452_43669 [Arctium lappa]
MTSKDALSVGTDVKPPVLFKGEWSYETKSSVLMMGAYESANDFLNSDDGCIDEIDMFDFNAPLPDMLPSGVNIDESSTKVGESVSVTADYYAQGKKHKKQRLQKQKYTGTQKKTQSQKSDFPNKSISFVSDIRKKRSKARTEWRPKRKDDEITESVSDNSCTRSDSSDSDVVSQYASHKQNLVTSYKRYCWELKKSLSMVNAASSELLLLEDFKVNTAEYYYC